MGLILQDCNAIYVHIGKTGGTTVKYACRQIGLSVRNPVASSVVHEGTALLEYMKERRLAYRFTFVRHPKALYESHWKFMNSGFVSNSDKAKRNPGQWFAQESILPDPQGLRFDEWMGRCLTEQPAYVTRLYEWYIGPPGLSRFHFVGRTESLLSDLCKVLHILDCQFDENRLMNCESQNVSCLPSHIDLPEWTGTLEEEMLRLERPTIKRWYTP